jgi:hypothetical protein
VSAFFLLRMMADYDVQMLDGDRVGEFFVKFHGPKDSTFGGTATQLRRWYGL